MSKKRKNHLTSEYIKSLREHWEIKDWNTLTDEQILSLPNVGKKTLKRIREG